MQGKLVHFEIPTKDSSRAKRFYGTLLGWSFKDSGMPGIDYWLTEGTEPPGAIMKVEDGQTGHPIIYFGVEDIEAASRQVRELGGTADEKGPVPGQGWFAGCKDTEGNAFSLWQSDHSVTVEQAAQYAEAHQKAGAEQEARA